MQENEGLRKSTAKDNPVLSLYRLMPAALFTKNREVAPIDGDLVVVGSVP